MHGGKVGVTELTAKTTVSKQNKHRYLGYKVIPFGVMTNDSWL